MWSLTSHVDLQLFGQPRLFKFANLSLSDSDDAEDEDKLEEKLEEDEELVRKLKEAKEKL